MNTKEVQRRVITDPKSGNYGFKRPNKALLNSSITIIQLLYRLPVSSQWSNAIGKLWLSLEKEFHELNNLKIYCFVATPFWQKDTSLINYYGLSKLLSRKYAIANTPFLFEKKLSFGNEVIFYGLAEINLSNAAEIFDYLSIYECGLVFALNSELHIDLSRLAKQFFEKSVISNKTSSILDLAQGVNSLTEKNISAIHPCDWKESGEYIIDIFRPKEPKKGKCIKGVRLD